VIDAGQTGLEDLRKVRVDSTVVPANINHPSESSLLWDTVRVLTRLIGRGRAIVEMPTMSHTRRAKRRATSVAPFFSPILMLTP